MDDNEIHYLTYSEEELWDAMTDAYLEVGGDVLYPGDEKEMLLRGVENIIMQAFAGIDNALRMDTLRYAVRDYLDLYGEKRNCYRIQAEAATAKIQISFSNSGVSKTFEAGTQLTADGVVMYQLTEDVTQTGSAGTVDTDIECTETGVIGNALLTGTMMQFLTPEGGVISVTVTEDAKGGQNEEDDETYRERIRTYGLSDTTTGTSEMYERIAKETSSEIIDAKALNEGDLEVYVYLILKDGANPTTIVNAVTEALSPKNERPLSDNVTVAVSEALTYVLNVSYTGADTTDLDKAVEVAVAKYKSWQENTIGQAFNPDMLKAYMYQAGCSMVVFTEGSEFDGGTAEYTEIDPEQCCKGTITTAVMSL